MNIKQLEKSINSLSPQELRAQFALCYGHMPTTRNRPHLIKKILWAHQRNAFGDISDVVRQKALAIADDRDVKERFDAPKSVPQEPGSTKQVMIAYAPRTELLPGTVLHRNYQGSDIRVLVLENGFEWEGKHFKSLSAVARALTGTRWNGRLFFGLKKGAR